MDSDMLFAARSIMDAVSPTWRPELGLEEGEAEGTRPPGALEAAQGMDLQSRRWNCGPHIIGWRIR